MKPVDVVAAQLEAYNQRNLDAFCDCFSEDIEVWDIVSKTLRFSGMQRFRQVYRQRFEDAKLHCQLLSRIAQGRVVIDHELVHSSTGVVRAIATYVINDQQVASVLFIQRHSPALLEREHNLCSLLGLLLFAIAALLLVQARPKVLWPVLILLAGCRLISFPLGRYQAEGHEATYLRFFDNNQAIEVGNTALYPLMQVWWWLLGRLGLDLVPYAPLVLSSMMGAVAVLCLTNISRPENKRQSRLFFLLWATQPILWLWSLSAYNVVFPFAFAAIAMWSMHNGQRALSTVCFLVAVLMRVELVLILPLFWTVEVKRTFPLVVISGVLAMLPLFWYEVPGSGEHWQSLQNNVGFWRPVLWFCPALLCAFLHRSARWLLLFVWVIGLLFIMSSFDDYGARHLLPLLLAGALWLRFRSKNIPQWVLLIAIIAQSAMLINVRSIWFVGEEAFSQKLSQQYPELPRVSLSQARQLGCAWISEHPLFQDITPRSHFNLYSKAEFHSLNAEHGCVDWCRDYNDFRWSTLSVMERAYRIDHLYESKAIAVVINESSDCLQLRLERR